MKRRTERAAADGGWVKSLLSSLSVRLFVLLCGAVLLSFSAFAFFSIRSTSRQWSQAVHGWAGQFSDLVKRSTHYGMLLDRKEDVHQIIRTVALEPGVEQVRIYDKHGTIIYSANAAEIGSQVDLQAEACVACHEHASPLRRVPESGRVRIFRRGDGSRVLGLINPIENAPECSSAPCHAHKAEQSLLGVLDVTLSMAEADAGLAAARRQIIVAGILTTLVVGLSSAAFILLLVRRPVERLIEGTESLAGGDLGSRVPEGDDEIGRLGQAFNHMATDLRGAHEELAGWSQRLEAKLREKTEELGRAQREVVHVEKMASLGKLAATVAHELNNPLSGILNYAKLGGRTLGEGPPDPGREEVGRYLGFIEKEAARCGTIVRNLLVFSRRSGTEMALHALNPIVERALMLIRHHLQMASIELVHRPLADEDDRLVCDADQVQQALVALLVNAVEAMPDGGTLRVEAVASTDTVELTVADTGIGIPPEALPHVFEPFFSTKHEASGAGLGLAVAYGIVRRHEGRISVESEPGRGTSFRITLPRGHEPPREHEIEEQRHA